MKVIGLTLRKENIALNFGLFIMGIFYAQIETQLAMHLNQTLEITQLEIGYCYFIYIVK